MAWIAQAWCGAALIGFAVQLYQRAGLDNNNAFSLNIGQSDMDAVGTVLSWFLMQHVRRRTIYLWEPGMRSALMITIGGSGFGHSTGASWVAGSLLIVYTFVYDLTVGPVCHSLVAEIPSTILKIKTVVLARNFYNIACVINYIIVPDMLGSQAWNWAAKSGLSWAGACVLLFIWTYFRLPERKGGTYGELDVLFEHRISARKFCSTTVDQFSGEHTDLIEEDSPAKQPFDYVEKVQQISHENVRKPCSPKCRS
jgi:SP family general alpha glucoside:H+ symporter-like MFS transporter